MRLLILADIHANIAALRSIEKDAGRIDAVYCAGDYVDYGTDPHEIIRWLKEHNAVCVMGNHDAHLLRILALGEAEAFRGTARYQWVHDNIDRITVSDADFLRALPNKVCFSSDGINYLMQHQMQEGTYDVPENLQCFNDLWANGYKNRAVQGIEKRMIFGHTHRRCVHVLDNDRLWMNPGSASYRRPDDPDKRAHYMIVENGRVEFRAVSYDRSTMLERTLVYVRTGTMLETDLQDAMFFFGEAKTTREPLPRV